MIPLAVMAGILLVLAVGLDRLALSILRPHHRPPGRTPEDVGLRSADWSLGGEPPLSGWRMEGADPDGPVVVLAHGWGANAGVVLPLAREVAPAAAQVFAFDVRGHGRSDRSPKVSIRQFRDDTIRALEGAAALHPGRPIILAGHSLGGAAGILAAAAGAPISGLITVATPYDVFGAIARYLKDRGLPGHLLVPLLRPFWRIRVGVPERKVHPGRALARVGIPVLVVQPELDTRVPVSDGRRLAAVAGTPMALVAGARHTDVLQHPELGRLVREFVTRVGAGGSPDSFRA